MILFFIFTLNDFIFLFLNLLGLHWLIQLCRFQVYNSIIHHLYIILCVYHPKSQVSFHHHLSLLYRLLPPPTPFPLVITMLLSVSMSFFLFCLIPLPFLPGPPNPLPTAANLFSVTMSLFLLCWFVYFVH